MHSLRGRLENVTWAWFSVTMSTGSLAVVLFQTPYKFHGLLTIGKVVFIIDLFFFCAISTFLAIRFLSRPNALADSLRNQSESFYFGTFFVSVALILENITQYASPSSGEWLVKTLEVLFWCYFASILLASVLHYETLFFSQNLRISDMTPTWILPIYPLLVTGPLAGVLVEHQPPGAASQIWVGGVLAQGLGWMVTTFLYAVWTIRLLCDDLPAPSSRPGMYIAVGPTGYTIQALISLGSTASKALPAHLQSSTSTSPADIIKIMGAISGIFLWLLVFWFFGLATLAIIYGYRKLTFSLTWWAFIFPNAGFTLATIQIGNILGSNAILWATSVMTAVLCIGWLLLIVLHVKVLWKGQLL